MKISHLLKKLKWRRHTKLTRRRHSNLKSLHVKYSLLLSDLNRIVKVSCKFTEASIKFNTNPFRSSESIHTDRLAEHYQELLRCERA
jgi:hypothetical protein